MKLFTRILTLALCAVLLLSTVSVVSAAEAATNVAPLGTAFCTSYKNPSWTPVESINDEGLIYGGWQGWEPLYPTTAGGPFSGEYCGIDFGTESFYEISGARLTLRYNAKNSVDGVNENPQDITYTLQALIEGEWVNVHEFHDHDYEGFDSLLHYDQFQLEATFDAVNTNKIRLYCSNYGKNFGGGDELVFPYVYELELFGVPGETPDIIIPEGQALNTNAALSGKVDASSASSGCWPALIIRNAIPGTIAQSVWKAAADDANAYISVALNDPTVVNAISLNFGADAAQIPYTVYATYENGVTTAIGSGTVKNGPAILNCKTEADPDGITVTGVKIVYDGEGAQLESINIIANEKLLYRTADDSDAYKQSVAKGNLAMIGTAYAESTFPDFSKVEYLNDGIFNTMDNPKSWFANGADTPTYCGIQLDGEYEVNKVVLYFESSTPAGANAMNFDVYAKVDGEYVKLVSGCSYDASAPSGAKYRPVFEFDPVVTDDIRVVFTTNGGIFPSMRELEIYSEADAPTAYMGYPTIYPIGGPSASASFQPSEDDLVYDTTTRDSLPEYNPAKDYSDAKDTTSDIVTDSTSDTSSVADSTSDTTKETTDDTTGTGKDPTEDPSSPVGPIVIGVVFAVCIAAVVVYVILSKKKKG